MTILDEIRAELAVATNRDAANAVISGKLELPKTDGPVVVRFNSDAYVEFPTEALVRNSITAFSCKEIQAITKRPSELALGLNDWFHVKIKRGASCTLHYKTIDVTFVLDRSVQQPFYIDTKALKCVYLEKAVAKRDPSQKQISCDEFSDDRTNKEVIVYYRHACCCNNNNVEAYGYVSCDDGWRDSDCL